MYIRVVFSGTLHRDNSSLHTQQKNEEDQHRSWRGMV